VAALNHPVGVGDAGAASWPLGVVVWCCDLAANGEVDAQVLVGRRWAAIRNSGVPVPRAGTVVFLTCWSAPPECLQRRVGELVADGEPGAGGERGDDRGRHLGAVGVVRAVSDAELLWGPHRPEQRRGHTGHPLTWARAASLYNGLISRPSVERCSGGSYAKLY